MTEDYFGITEPWVKHTRSTDEIRVSNSLAIVPREDFVAAPERMAYDHDRAEWAFNVRVSYGFPRKPLGILVMRLTDEGDLVLSLE